MSMRRNLKPRFSMLRSFFLFASLLSSAVPVASALTLSLSEIGPRVRAAHPSLKAARVAVDEARGRQLGSGRLSNPTVVTEFQNESQVSPGSIGISLDQAFPLTRRLKLERKLSAQLVEAAELEVRDAERKLVAEAQALAVKLLAVNQQQALRQQQTALAGKLSQFANSRAKAGEISALDATQIEVDNQKLLIESRRLDIEGITVTGALKPLLGIDPDEPLQMAGELPGMNLPARSASWQQRADYQSAQRKVESTDTEIDLAKAKRYSDMSAGLFTAREWQKTDSRREGTGYVGVRLSLPWPLWNRNEGEIAEKTASRTRAQLEVIALAAQIAGEADAARREMAGHLQLLRDTQDKVLPRLTDQTTKLEKAYQSGQTDLITLQRARDLRLQMEATVIDARRDFHLARIRYETAIDKGSTK
ncbi:MAG: outer membrane protein cobalt-zinc-cadmium efflux system [Verrucomicrobiaceae bacterium]|nr:outer membrane protein cobalt-zinc-cadmium efflux system [Verrucomicrobiaceae bacterium]